MTTPYGDDPNNWSAERMNEFVNVILDALAGNNALASDTTVLGQPAVFYDWSQGDLTFEEMVQIVNRCGRKLITPITLAGEW